MNMVYSAVVMLLAVASQACLNQPPTRNSLSDGSVDRMEENRIRANKHLDQFERKKSTDDLREAADILEGLTSGSEGQRKAHRRPLLMAWLRLLNLIDENFDQSFNPADVPAISQVPPGPEGLAYPSGTKPEDIKDPDLRKRYEKMLDENRRKSEAYAFQTGLRRLNDRVTPEVVHFLVRAYTPATPDREEWRGAIAEAIKSPERAAELKEAVVRGGS
jgi:hypothetical protein